MSRRGGFGVVLCALVCGLAAAPSRALTIEPGEVLLAPFELAATAGVDVLTFRLVGPPVGIGVSSLRVELYDGATLLGAVNGVAMAGIAAFVSPGSLWTTNAVSVDLSSLLDGTSAGLVRVVPQFAGSPPTGALTASVSSVTSFTIGQGTDAASILPVTGVLTVGEPSVVLPEPGGFLLLAAALAVRRVRRSS